ncbi:hypothetical protein GCM10010178_68560 [Lentzea flava]|uniref:Nucleoside diphosphate kinase n=1 Tax=Lentzea flava TaxID=103732 RepID=A0ABQ2V6C8_9PSEU|nr:nucleoside diphosphate kinase [Lentzea flava]GGU67054.1 hypothetical protein GCM10010178_68560 [Lentzea flava]
MSPTSAHELLRDERWRSLTADQEKLRAYADDEWFRSGLDAAYEVLGDNASRLVQRHAVLVIQPDCVAGRTAERCVDHVRRQGFEPVRTIRFHFGAEQTAGIWHYQSNISTPDSLDIADQVCGKGDSLVVLLRDTTAEPVIPASLRLTDLKGRSNPAKRTEHHLRTILGAQTVLVVLVHTPDEPVDLIRETSVLLGPRMRELYAAMAQPVPPGAAEELAAHIRDLYAESEAHDLDLQAAWERVTARITDQEALSTLDKVRHGNEKLDWPWFTGTLAAAGVDPHGWDALLIGSEHIEHDLPGIPRLVDRVSIESWTNGEGVLLTRA